MKTRAIAVSLLLLGARGLLFSIGIARAADPKFEPDATPQAASEEAKGALEEAKEQELLLRGQLKKRQKELDAMLNLNLKEAEKRITFLQNEIKRVQEDKLANRPEMAAAKNKVLDDYRRELDHYMIVRSKVDEDAVDLAPDSGIDETKFAKYQKARIKLIEAELAKKEKEVSALNGSVPKTSSEPAVAADSAGIVPNLNGMTRLEALAALQSAQLHGSVKDYVGKKPKNKDERDQMIVVSQWTAAGTKLIPGKGVVSVTLGWPGDSKDEKIPPEHDGPMLNNKTALPEELRGNWTGQIVVTQGSEKLPAECKTVNVEGGKMAEGITMNLGELNEFGKGQLTFGAQHQGEQKQEEMPFSYDATKGKLHIQQQRDEGTITLDGYCFKNAEGLFINGKWTVKANGMSLGGTWKQTKQQ